MDKDLKLLLVQSISSTAFAEELARNIGGQATQQILDEFYNEVSKRLDEQVKIVVDKYIADYKQDDIERIVDQAVKNITKKEILGKAIKCAPPAPQ